MQRDTQRQIKGWNPATAGIAVVELRQYTFHPRQRKHLIELFEQHFLAAQEACGAQVLGHFCDFDDPDRFVWLRGFHDMAQRKEALEAFYDGETWKVHRDEVSEMILDFANVLLLRPLSLAPVQSGGMDDTAIVGATIWPLTKTVTDSSARTLARDLSSVLTQAGAQPLATFVTEPSANNFPRLPVREEEYVLALFARFDGLHSSADSRAAFESLKAWASDRPLAAPLQVLRLEPCTFSRLR